MSEVKHKEEAWKIIRTNNQDQPDEFAVIGPGNLRDEGYTSSDSALRSALNRANEALSVSRSRLFAAQSIAVQQGEALVAMVRGAELLDDYCMGGSRPPHYDLPSIRDILNHAANGARLALATKGA